MNAASSQPNPARSPILTNGGILDGALASTTQPRKDAIVLKFGGSVLPTHQDIHRVVLEIHRWRRRGFRVVAVVSALAGRTDELLAEACAVGIDDDYEMAAHLARGELESASLLAERLWDAGIGTRVLTPQELDLLAEGDPLDATPITLRDEPLVESLGADLVAVVPGFVGVDTSGKTVLLGRGGSDLTALFLADQLRARCRLVKDVDGLYDSNPASQTVPAPRRYHSASFEAALATDGSILQHKALRFARDRNLSFEVGACGNNEATVVGHPTRFGIDRTDDNATVRTRIALLGCGTVGSEVARALSARRDEFEVVAIAVAQIERERPSWIPRELLCSSQEALGRSPDILIEMIGDADGTESTLRRALVSGIDVVTANKAVLARCGRELQALARLHGRTLSFAATVGGAVPVLETIASHELQGRRLTKLRGIANSTANVILDLLTSGARLSHALGSARSRGLAESDPWRDLDGQDSADKLAVVALAITGGSGLPFEGPRHQVDTRAASITESTRELALAAAARGERLRQVATLVWTGHRVTAEVSVQTLSKEDPLHAVTDDRNRFILVFEDGSTHLLDGRGAGAGPTTTAVLGDLEELMRRRRNRATRTRPLEQGAFDAI